MAKVAAAKKAAPKKAAAETEVKKPAAKKAAPKKATAAAPAKRRGRPPGKKAAAAAPAKRGRPPGKKAAAAAAPAKRGRPPGKKAAATAAPAKRGRPPGKKAAAAATPARRGRPPGKKAAAPVAPAKRRGRPPGKKPAQSFTVSHLNEADFKADGLRAYALYRDLGIAAGSNGLCQAHVIRLLSPCTDEVRKRHAHSVDLQLIYVLKGWIKNEFEGHGPQMMSAGSCWLQPPGIPHTVLDYSPDCEMLEIVVPADFKTTELT